MSNSYLRGVKIIGGKWRGKRLKVLNEKNLRPSSSRTRETLFNWLAPHISGAVCLDLFSGSGALAFESLSRGAKWVTMIDHDKNIAEDLARKSREMAPKCSEVVLSDSLTWLAAPQKKKFDIVYLDPPFEDDCINRVLFALTNGWLTVDALIYVEQTEGNFNLPTNWKIKKFSKTAKVAYALLANNV